MLQRRTRICNELGLHARPAAKIAGLARKAKAPVWLIKNGERVDAGSVIDILTLACGIGSDVVFEVENNADGWILDDIIRLVDDGFGE